MIENNIKNLRKKRGMTLKELSEKVNHSTAYLSQIENGKYISDKKIEEILMSGFDFHPQEARITIDRWRIEERLNNGNVSIEEFSQNIGVIHNNSGHIGHKKEPKPPDKINQAIEMAKAGLSEEMIKKLLNL